jgi:hypothetical protein
MPATPLAEDININISLVAGRFISAALYEFSSVSSYRTP